MSQMPPSIEEDPTQTEQNAGPAGEISDKFADDGPDPGEDATEQEPPTQVDDGDDSEDPTEIDDKSSGENRS